MGATVIAGRSWLARGVPVMAMTALAVGGVAGGGASAATAAAVPGTITTVAGGVGGPGRATNVPLFDPCGVSVANGLLNIADTHSNRVRVVAETSGTFYGQSMTAGDIYTVAGGGTAGVANGIPATTATLGFANGVAVDPQGNLVISTSKQRVRVVAESTGTFYGIAMTAGDIYTVAGDGTFGFSGDGGPATGAALSYPDAVAVNGASLVFADQDTSRIRQVTG